MKRDTHFIRRTSKRDNLERIGCLTLKSIAYAEYYRAIGANNNGNGGYCYDTIEWCRVNRKGQIVVVAKQEFAQ